jgi:hypothetical protein
MLRRLWNGAAEKAARAPGDTYNGFLVELSPCAARSASWPTGIWDEYMTTITAATSRSPLG